MQNRRVLIVMTTCFSLLLLLVSQGTSLRPYRNEELVQDWGGTKDKYGSLGMLQSPENGLGSVSRALHTLQKQHHALLMAELEVAQQSMDIQKGIAALQERVSLLEMRSQIEKASNAFKPLLSGLWSSLIMATYIAMAIVLSLSVMHTSNTPSEQARIEDIWMTEDRVSSQISEPRDTRQSVVRGNNTITAYFPEVRESAQAARDTGSESWSQIFSPNESSGTRSSTYETQAAGDVVSPDHCHRVFARELTALQVLSEGAFGEVLKCTNNLFGQIAVKFNKDESGYDGFLQEIYMQADLSHPNVLKCYGAVSDNLDANKVVGCMTEFMEGGSLSRYIRPESEPLTLLERCQLAKGAVNGLMYLHRRNVIHFDIKPDNFLLEYPLSLGHLPKIKIADLGLAMYKTEESSIPDAGVRGTLCYMAPEVLIGHDAITENADVWSLGMVLWQMFTHQAPFEGMLAGEIQACLMSGRARPPIPLEMEREWAELINACCRPNPSRRVSLDQLSSRLDQLIDQQTVSSPSNTPH